jgi:hypothetical protein
MNTLTKSDIVDDASYVIWGMSMSHGYRWLESEVSILDLHHVYNQMWTQVLNQVQAQVLNQVQAQVVNQVRNQVNEHFNQQ